MNWSKRWYHVDIVDLQETDVYDDMSSEEDEPPKKKVRNIYHFNIDYITCPHNAGCMFDCVAWKTIVLSETSEMAGV